MRPGFSSAILVALQKNHKLGLSTLLSETIKNQNGQAGAPTLIKYRRNFFQGLYYLDKKKYIQIYDQAGQRVVEITSSGVRRIESEGRALIQIHRPSVWDKKWRMIAFDIPLKQKSSADAFRNKLKALNFHQVQRSLWVFPFPCEEAVEQLCDIYKIRECVTMMLVARMTNDGKLKKVFGLAR